AKADFRLALHQVRAENAFDRAHQPPVEAIHIRRHCLAAETARAVFGAVEHRGGYGRKARLDFCQLHTAHAGKCERGIRRAEVDGTKVGHEHPSPRHEIVSANEKTGRDARPAFRSGRKFYSQRNSLSSGGLLLSGPRPIAPAMSASQKTYALGALVLGAILIAFAPIFVRVSETG